MSTILEEIPEAVEDTSKKTGFLPPYNVIIKNDDVHTMAFVVLLLMEVFGYEKMKSISLMAAIHQEGEAIVWTGSKEVAEFKVEQILARPERDLGPLDARIEPAR